MITTKGKQIIAKYLIGQAPAFASYIAVGCGAKPLGTTTASYDQFGDYSSKASLDFEMFRVPISSRGFVNEDGISKIVFTAELPTEERYEMTEIGLYSAGANPSAGLYDSRPMYSFNEGENWEYHDPNTQSAPLSISTKNSPLDADGTADIINIAEKVFRTTADNKIFTTESRVSRNERGRYLNDTIMISGDTSKLDINNNGSLSLNSQYDSSHIHFNGTTLDFSRQSPIDEIRIAFSVVNKDGNSDINPSRVLMMAEFASGDQANPDEYARFYINIANTNTVGALDNFSTNRYFVVSKQLQELDRSSGFSWGSVNIIKIYACILDDNEDPTSNYYIALDGIRLENLSTNNALYGLVGYTVIANQTRSPIIKEQNTTNYIEFRTGVGIV